MRTLSAIPARSSAQRLPNNVGFVFPEVFSVDMNRIAVSRVTNRTPDLDALEAQKAKLRVYNCEIPCWRIVFVSNRRGYWGPPLPAWNSC